MAAARRYLSRACSRGLAQYFQCAQGSGVAAFNADLLEHTAEVLLHCLFAHAQDDGDLGIGFALSNPKEDFGFPRGDSKLGLQRNSGAEVRMKTAKVGGGPLQLLGESLGASESGVHGGKQVFANDGFGEVIVRAEVHADSEVGLIGFGGEKDKGSGGEFRF